MDGTKLALPFFYFPSRVFRSRMSILPLLLLCLFKNSRHSRATCLSVTQPTAEVQVSQGRERVRNGYPLLGREGP